MSTAWKGSAVLLREPASAFWSRFGYRLMMAVILGLAASYMPYAWLAAPIWLFAGLMGLLAVLAVANTLKNRRALLVHTGAGSIEWPLSFQEIILRRPLTWVAGREIEVTFPPVAALPGKLDPRITLSDGERTIERVPLYGVDPEVFVTAANTLLAGRGTTLVYVAREIEPPTADSDE